MKDADQAAVGRLSGCPEPLAEAFDVALLDLDGVVYRGGAGIPHAVESLDQARDRGMRLAYVTNNALRTPETVAERLQGFGVDASAEDVITSAQAAARVLAERLDPDAAVLVTGGAGLRVAVEAVGLRPVAGAGDDPAAVVQGYDPEITYDRLAEAALAIRGGAFWVASNTDATVPTERGLLPGAGAFVALLRTATDREPLVAGKPEWALHAESIQRTEAQRPLVVGDRLDTDIEGAVRAGTPSLLVLTGVAKPADLVRAPADKRPSFLGQDLRALLRPAPPLAVDGTAATCGSWCCEVIDGSLRWSRVDASNPGRDDSDDGLDALRAACAAAWAAADTGVEITGTTGDVPEGCAGLS